MDTVIGANSQARAACSEKKSKSIAAGNRTPSGTRGDHSDVGRLLLARMVLDAGDFALENLLVPGKV